MRTSSSQELHSLPHFTTLYSLYYTLLTLLHFTTLYYTLLTLLHFTTLYYTLIMQELHSLMRAVGEEANKELTKTEIKLRGELGDVKSSIGSKVDSDVAAVKKQVERVLVDSRSLLAVS